MRFLLLSLLICALRVAVAEPGIELSAKEIDSLFAWFDRLPLRSVEGCEYVRIWTGESGWMDQKHLFRTNDGFLLADEGHSFQVVLSDWTVATFEKSGTEPETNGFVGYRVISLENETGSLARNLEKPGQTNDFTPWPPGDHLARTAQLFSIARICAQRRHREEGAALIACLDPSRHLLSDQNGLQTLREVLSVQFEHSFRLDAIHDIRVRGVSRADLLAKFRQIDELFPALRDAEESVHPFIEKLETQLREDVSHRALSELEFVALPPAKQAEELAYRLRDETGIISDIPDPLHDLPSNGSYAGLISLKFDAVPALVAALDQKGDTRSILTGQPGEEILTESIHDAALAALGEIAGLDFSRRFPNGDPLSSADREPEIRRRISEWAAAAAAGEEKSYLIGKLHADGAGEQIAECLLARYPEIGEREIARVTPSVADPSLRSKFLELLWDHDGPECRELFTAELHAGPAIKNRVAAALGLRLLKDPQALLAMRAEWEKLRPALPGYTGAGLSIENLATDSDLDSPLRVIAFLASSAAPEAILVLGPDSGRLPAKWSYQLIELLSRTLSGEAIQAQEPLNAATKLAIEDVLDDFLEDTTPFADPALAGTREIYQARLCDYAGKHLQEIWPQKYLFDAASSPAVRDRRALECRNVHLRELGEPLLPMPIEAPPARLSPDAACTISRIEWSPGSAELAGPWQTKAAALVGKALQSGALTNLLTAYAANPPGGVHALSIDVVRYDDLTGITVMIRLLAGAPLDAPEICTLEVFSFRGTYGSEGPFSGMVDPVRWKDLGETIEKAGIFKPDQQFLIRISLCARKDDSSAGIALPPSSGIPGL